MSKIELSDSFLFIDAYRIPILIKYNKYNIDTLGWCNGGERECLRFSFFDTIKSLKYSIDFKKFKEDRLSPSAFINESDVENLYIDSSYKRVIYKVLLLNKTYKYLFTFYGIDFYTSEFKYYHDKHYFKLLYYSEIEDSLKTNLLMEKVFDMDFKVK